MNYEEITIDWIRKRMEEKGLKQKDIAELWSMEKSTISKLLNSESRSPLKTRFQKLAFWYLLNDT